MRRLALPLLAGLVTSAVIAAFGLAGNGNGNGNGNGPPQPVAGQVIGQLMIENGPAMPILSYSFGASNPATIGSGGGGSGAGKVSLSSLNMLRSVDRSSSMLLDDVASGKHLQNAVFTAQWGSGSSAASAKYELSGVFVESVQHSGSGGGPPVESLSLAFEKIKWTFTDSSGTSSGSWDITTNSP
jgi:type VI secretion system secreted protein Hcp